MENFVEVAERFVAKFERVENFVEVAERFVEVAERFVEVAEINRGFSATLKFWGKLSDMAEFCRLISAI